MVMLTPTLRALKTILPDSMVTVIGRQPSIQVIQGWDAVDSVIVAPDDGIYDICFLPVWSRKFWSDHAQWVGKHCREYVRFGLDENQHEAEGYFRIASSLGYAEQMPPSYCGVKPAGIDDGKRGDSVRSFPPRLCTVSTFSTETEVGVVPKSSSCPSRTMSWSSKTSISTWSVESS